jgi:hypothetical protein
LDKNLNPGLHTENWRVLSRQSEPKGQTLILHIDWYSLVDIQKTGYHIVTGLSQGTIKVLRDPEVRKEAVPNIVPQNRCLRRSEMEHPLPGMTEEEQQM